MSRYARPLSIVLVLMVVFSAAAIAQELRIETDVFLGDSTESVAHTVTMLQSGTFFDFTESPDRVTVFRRPVGRPAGEVHPDRPGQRHADRGSHRQDPRADDQAGGLGR